MALLFDYRCPRCRKIFEEFVEHHEMTVPCACGGTAKRVYLRAPIVGAKCKGIYPKYDVQSGITFDSAQQERAHYKAKGYEALSPAEWRWTDNTSTSQQESIDNTGLREAMEEAHYKLTNGLEQPEGPKIVDSPPDILVN